MLNIKKATTVMIGSMLIISSANTHNYVYAATTGSIKIKANIECKFDGKICIALSDSKNNKKFIFLTQENNFKLCLDSLKYDKYKISNVVFYDNDKIKSDVQTDIKAEYTINSGNLNLNQDNQISDVIMDVHSIKKVYSDSKTKVEEKKDDNIKNQKSLELRKKINLFNFIFDIVSISVLSLIWFFKVDRKDKKIIEILARKGKK